MSSSAPEAGHALLVFSLDAVERALSVSRAGDSLVLLQDAVEAVHAYRERLRSAGAGIGIFAFAPDLAARGLDPTPFETIDADRLVVLVATCARNLSFV
jgi:sulfur relay protein TusB/DsrH